jgi:hypothetical protein
MPFGIVQLKFELDLLERARPFFSLDNPKNFCLSQWIALLRNKTLLNKRQQSLLKMETLNPRIDSRALYGSFRSPLTYIGQLRSCL